MIGTTFRSLRVRNYRLFFFGQLISVTGSRAQDVALAWLVYRHLPGGDALDLGLILAAQQGPMLVLGAWGGVLTDRFDRRHAMIATQTVMAVSALALGVLDLTGEATLLTVAAIVFVQGIAMAIDIPARQVLVHEMVGPDNVVNAVGLSSAVYHGCRVLGPALGGVLIVTVGTGWCFVVNAATYLAAIVAILAMHRDELLHAPVVARAKGQVRAGLRYLAGHRTLRSNIVFMLVIGVFAMAHPVFLPVMASETFDGDAGMYSLMTAVMGIGAVAGALVAASRALPTNRFLLQAGAAYGLLMAGGSVLPDLVLVLAALAFVGLTSTAMLATSNALVQLAAAPEMRGRVLAVRATTIMGTGPLGQPLAGWVTNEWGPRWAMGLGGVAALLAAAWFARATGPEPSATEGGRWPTSPDASTTWPT